MITFEIPTQTGAADRLVFCVPARAALFIGLRVEDCESCTSVLHQVEAKLQQVRDRAEALRRVEGQPLALQATCRRIKSAEKCSFLNADS